MIPIDFVVQLSKLLLLYISTFIGYFYINVGTGSQMIYPKGDTSTRLTAGFEIVCDLF